MKLIGKVLPLIVIALTIANLFSSYYNHNDAAFSANITALFGWIYVAIDSFDRKVV